MVPGRALRVGKSDTKEGAVIEELWKRSRNGQQERYKASDRTSYAKLARERTPWIRGCSTYPYDSITKKHLELRGEVF